jgi:calcineurin-like phosphoesterase family protein
VPEARPYRYWSDLHLDHRQIIPLFQRRFASVEEMNAALLAAWAEALEQDDGTLFNLGDVAFGFRRFVERARIPAALERERARSVLIAGNNDGVATSSRRAYQRYFGTIVGHEHLWETNTHLVEDRAFGVSYRVLLSHAPQEDLQGADYNLYGHHHSGFLLHPERIEEWGFGWLRPGDAQSPYLNVSVELVGYRPRTLEELMTMRAAGLHLL